MTYLNEQDILDFLMTSDFQEGFNNEETRFLLLKFRYHYRVLHAKMESMNYQLDQKDEQISSFKKEINDLKDKISKIEENLTTEITRKLTWKERFYGKKLID